MTHIKQDREKNLNQIEMFNDTGRNSKKPDESENSRECETNTCETPKKNSSNQQHHAFNYFFPLRF